MSLRCFKAGRRGGGGGGGAEDWTPFLDTPIDNK